MGGVPDAGTQLAGVVGHPVVHSLSPAIQNAALRHDGRNAVYLAFDVPRESFAPFVEGMRAGGVRGLNVTLPHKGAAFELASSLSGDAEATSAVNLLVFTAAEIQGHNTDVVGVGRALGELGVPEGARALVIGAGGAGRATARALSLSGAEVLVANRTPERAAPLAERFSGTAVGWTDLDETAASVDVVVHATSLGLRPEDDPVLGERSLATAVEKGCRFLLDLVYAPGETELVRVAREAGLVAADGLSMLVHQGAEAYRLLWGADAPIEVMREAARQRRRGRPGRRS